MYVCTGPLYLPKKDPNDGKNYVKYQVKLAKKQYKERMTAVFFLFFKFQVIGDNQVAVPTHFFKVLVGELDNLQLEMEAYVLPNEPIPDNVALATFQVKITNSIFS